MKKILLILLFFAVPANAVTLAWDANTDSAIGYILYYGDHSEVIQGRENTTITVDNNKFVPGQEYSFYVTAFNDSAESGPSNVVTWTAPMFVPPDNPAPVVINIPAAVENVTINIGD